MGKITFTFTLAHFEQIILNHFMSKVLIQTYRLAADTENY